MPEAIVKGVNCCKGRRGVRKALYIEPRRKIVKPRAEVRLELKNYYEECEPVCWHWNLRSGGGRILIDGGFYCIFEAPDLDTTCANLAVIDFYCGGRTQDSAYIAVSQNPPKDDAWIQTTEWEDGYYPRDNDCRKFGTPECYTYWSKKFQEYRTGVRYVDDPGWCGHTEVLTSCLEVSHYLCDGTRTHKTAIGLKCYCINFGGGRWELNLDRFFSPTGFYLNGIFYRETYPGNFADAKQAVINDYLRRQPFPKNYQEWLKLDPQPWFYRKLKENLLKENDILDIRAPWTKEKDCCIPGK